MPFSNPGDPYPDYRRLREEDPVHRVAPGQWMITSYADASLLLQDGRCLHWGQDKKAFAHWPPVEKAIAKTLYSLSPGNDLPYRKQILHQLAGSHLFPEEAAMQSLGTRLLGQMRKRSDPDFIRDFAHPLTFGTISRVIGVPEEQQEALSEIVAGMEGGYLACIDAATGQSTPAGRAFVQHLRMVVADRRETPGNDLCSLLLDSSREEADQETFLLSMLILLFYAGHLNMMNFLGNALLALHQHPDVLDQLRQDPDLLRKSIDELLRYDSPLQFIMLVAGEELPAGGKIIPAGDRIMVGVGAANRDPAAFEHPDRILPGRQARHLSFGAGAFRCIGARLAQLQGYVGLNSWLQYAEDYYPEVGQVIWRTQPFVQRGPAALPLKKV
jgi:cytochrome P450